ncbi:hypothetical protein EG329_009503 [Mollisiaceae sp. DMI_Dod_QoI]|nr:hypothetical protein EG329_009503 [Helotiales sp. DMI_Dod_QoI]
MNSEVRTILAGLVRFEWDSNYKFRFYNDRWVIGDDQWPKRQNENDDDDDILMRRWDGVVLLCLDNDVQLEIVVAEDLIEALLGPWLDARAKGHSQQQFCSLWRRSHAGHRDDVDFIVRSIENNAEAVGGAGPGLIEGTPKRRRTRKKRDPPPCPSNDLSERERAEGWTMRGLWELDETSNEWFRTLVRARGNGDVGEEEITAYAPSTDTSHLRDKDTRNQYWLERNNYRRGGRG